MLKCCNSPVLVEYHLFLTHAEEVPHCHRPSKMKELENIIINVSEAQRVQVICAYFPMIQYFLEHLDAGHSRLQITLQIAINAKKGKAEQSKIMCSLCFSLFDFLTLDTSLGVLTVKLKLIFLKFSFVE